MQYIQLSVLCFVYLLQMSSGFMTHIIQGFFTDIGAIVRIERYG